MTHEQYTAFDTTRKNFSSYVETLNTRSPWLRELQEELRKTLGYEDYAIETPIVYNRALDEIGLQDQPQFIIVADNPGKNEQKEHNQRYLIGQSGKLAKSWFKNELNMDFYKTCLIINKTPIHTPKTAEISRLRALARAHSAKRGKELDELLYESQRFMANLAFTLHSALGCVAWVSGYGELKPGKIFSAWADETTRLYTGATDPLRESFWVFRHFSMNQFAIEYKKTTPEKNSPLARLASIGKANRLRILGW